MAAVLCSLLLQVLGLVPLANSAWPRVLKANPERCIVLLGSLLWVQRHAWMGRALPVAFSGGRYAPTAAGDAPPGTVGTGLTTALTCAWQARLTERLCVQASPRRLMVMLPLHDLHAV